MANTANSTAVPITLAANTRPHIDKNARKPSALSATTPMPEDFPNGQKGICRLPAVSPLMYSTTKAKLPNQTPSKTLVISASAAMPKDLQLWAERNRKIDALRSRSDRQTSGRSKLASLGNTVAVSRLQSFSVSLRKPEDSTIICPTAPQGHNRLRSQSAMQPSSHESES